MSDNDKNQSQSSGSSQNQSHSYKAGSGSSYPGETHSTTDHDVIKKWVEERGGSPAVVKDTTGGSDVGLLRINYPGYSGAGSLENIPWSEFFKEFDQKHLVFMYQDRMENGQVSRFSKMVSQQTAQADEDEQKHSQEKHQQSKS